MRFRLTTDTLTSVVVGGRGPQWRGRGLLPAARLRGQPGVARCRQGWCAGLRGEAPLGDTTVYLVFAGVNGTVGYPHSHDDRFAPMTSSTSCRDQRGQVSVLRRDPGDVPAQGDRPAQVRCPMHPRPMPWGRPDFDDGDGVQRSAGAPSVIRDLRDPGPASPPSRRARAA